MRAALIAFLALLSTSSVKANQKPLEIFFIDVEGGQATLFVSPAGGSLLIDTGWGYNAYRDANRIADVAKRAKLKKIDCVLITHYHADHVGGVPQLAAKIPIGTFLDHGPNREDSNATNHLYSEYQAAIGASHRMLVTPGEKLPVKGMDAVVVSADGKLISQPLNGAGQVNPFCSGVEQRPVDLTENARSVGVVITFGSLRIVDLGDLTWNKELELVCPGNKLGRADILVVSHHGMDLSNSPALVHALAPRVAIFDNGSKKGAAPAAWDTVKTSAGLEDIWQLHFADAGGIEHNAADPFLANVTEADTGFYLKLTATPDGSFTVSNSRNKYQKQYSPR